MTQTRLLPKKQVQKTYGGPQLNEIHENYQRIELSRGCIRNCPFCFEPTKREVFPTPEIVRNYVKIIDMNPLMRPDILDVIKELGDTLVDGKVVYYEEVSGFDYRLITQEIADALKRARFIRPRIAWDWEFQEQMMIRDAIDRLVRAGYQRNEIMVFMIMNWRIPKWECERKLDLLKVWNIKVCDCCYDGGYKYAIPEYWTAEEIDEFRAKCRKHNQFVNFRIDPEISRSYSRRKFKPFR